jgi:DNA-3-methyladenine glycosylase II
MQANYNKKLRLAEKHITKVCPRMATWIQHCGKCQLVPEWEREPFESLVRAVAHQQLHGKAAEAILKRLTDRYTEQSFPTPQQLARTRIETYRKCGFSLSKAEAIRGIAKGALQGVVPTREQADGMSNEELVLRITELRGIGKWTVEMLLIFTMGRLDVMPVDDFGVRAGLMQMYGLDSMPKKDAFTSITDRWGPYRSIGAWYLWRYADEQKVLKREQAKSDS